MTKILGYALAVTMCWVLFTGALLFPIYVAEHNGAPWWEGAIYAGLTWTIVDFVGLAWKKKRR